MNKIKKRHNFLIGNNRIVKTLAKEGHAPFSSILLNSDDLNDYFGGQKLSGHT